MTMIKKVNLALQGGGAHGAYSWGVLDRLLEDEHIDIEGISGTSGGAMNAAIMIDGYIKGGRPAAREALDTFWYRVSEVGKFSPIQNTSFQRIAQNWNLDWSPIYTLFDIMTRIFSPYETNPLNINPLKNIFEDMVDFKNLQNLKDKKLFITATNINTGQAKIFEHHELTIDALMASACLPFMFQAVEIEGEHYWDGSYMGNPSIWPLIYNCEASDIVIIETNPIYRKQKPVKGDEIINRINEISFNAGLIAEMRAIHFVNRLIDGKHLDEDKYRKLHIHLIAQTEEMQQLNASSKMNTGWEFLKHLRLMGRNSADLWIKKNFHSIGYETTIDIENTFLNGNKQRKKNHKKDHI